MDKLAGTLQAIAAAQLPSRDRKRLQWQATATSMGVAGHCEEKDAIEDMAEVYSLIKHAGYQVKGASGIKKLLKSFGLQGKEMAKRVQARHMARNGQAHPDPDLLVYLQSLLEHASHAENNKSDSGVDAHNAETEMGSNESDVASDEAASESIDEDSHFIQGSDDEESKFAIRVAQTITTGDVGLLDADIVALTKSFMKLNDALKQIPHQDTDTPLAGEMSADSLAITVEDQGKRAENDLWHDGSLFSAFATLASLRLVIFSNIHETDNIIFRMLWDRDDSDDSTVFCLPGRYWARLCLGSGAFLVDEALVP